MTYVRGKATSARITNLRAGGGNASFEKMNDWNSFGVVYDNNLG